MSIDTKSSKSDLLGFIVVFSRLILLLVLAFLSYLSLSYNLVAGLIVYYIYCTAWNFSSWVGIGHELSHKSFFKSKHLNSIFLVIFSYMTLTNHNLFWITHSEHHRNTHGPNDFESPPMEMCNCSPNTALMRLNLIDITKLLNTIKYLYLNSTGVVPNNALVRLLQKDSDLLAIRRVAVSRMFYLLIITYLSIIFHSVWLFALLILPNFVGTSLTKNMALIQHPSYLILNNLGIKHASISNTKIPLAELHESEIRDKLDVQLPQPLSFLYANMNYHATHHLRPLTPSYRLKLVSRILCNRGQVGVISLHWSIIPRLCFAAL